MLLDNRTLLISLMLISALMALSLIIVSRQAERDGLSKWAGALALESLVWLLVAARGAIPDFYSILIANVLMAVAQAMKLAAIHEYRKQDFPYVQCLLPVGLTLIVFLILPYEDVRSRFVFSSSIFCAQMLMMLRALRTDTDSRAGSAWWLLYGATMLMVPLLALRAIAALSGTFEFATPYSATAPNPVQLAVFVGLIALDLLGSMGFILMIKERGDREIRALAMTDSLTRVSNRRAFMDQAEKQAAAAQRLRYPLALLMIDIDHFKRINDGYGHPTGDKVLIKVAETIASQLRKQDTLGRYGGEEFCVLLPATNEAGAIALAEKLRLAVEAMPLQLGQNSISITISLGVAAWNATGEDCQLDCNTLLQDADRALYQAKEKGRNRTAPLPLSSAAQQPA